MLLRLSRHIDVLPVITGRFGSVTLLPYAIVFIAGFEGGMAFAHFEGISLFGGMYGAIPPSTP